MKIYTGSGDRGKTSLFSGERVAKGHLRIEAYGDVDELNSVLGWLASVIPREQDQLIGEIRRIQSDLFHIGAWLATTPDSQAIGDLQSIGADFYQSLESAIDRMQDQLKPLGGFILPGGHMSAAVAHVARAVSRRSERHVVALSETFASEKTPEDYDRILIYLNRLSDYLFVLARYCNRINGSDDIPWVKDLTYGVE